MYKIPFKIEKLHIAYANHVSSMLHMWWTKYWFKESGKSVVESEFVIITMTWELVCGVSIEDWAETLAFEINLFLNVFLFALFVLKILKYFSVHSHYILHVLATNHCYVKFKEMMKNSISLMFARDFNIFLQKFA